MLTNHPGCHPCQNLLFRRKAVSGRCTVDVDVTFRAHTVSQLSGVRAFNANFENSSKFLKISFDLDYTHTMLAKFENCEKHDGSKIRASFHMMPER